MNGVGVWRSYTPPMACSAIALSMSDSAEHQLLTKTTSSPFSAKQCSFQYSES